MAFRVLVIGGRGWCDYGHLRDTLDAALANRLPDVELVTAGRACRRSRPATRVRAVYGFSRFPSTT